MEKQYIRLLIGRLLRGKANKSETDTLNRWYNQKIGMSSPIVIKADREVVLSRVMSRINHTIQKKTESAIFTLRRIVWMAVAALAIFALLIPVVITLRTPKEVRVTCSLGEHKEIRLSDGSLIFLDSKSSLTYMDRFTDSIRFVNLEGEAFFEITKNPQQPFVVKTAKARIRVLGTSFSVKSTEGEDIQVLVKTGIVAVAMNNNINENYILTKDDKLSIRKKEIMVNDVIVVGMPDEPSQFKVLKFNGISLTDIGSVLEREFGVKCLFEPGAFSGMKYVGEFRPDEGIDNIINSLSSALEVKMTKKGNQITIKTN